MKMQTIEIIIGSPRKNGNTAFLANQLKQLIIPEKASSNISFLYNYEIKPCIDCRGCKKGELSCTISDGASTLYEKIEKADFLVFGTPIYWFGPTATMKLFIDRLRPYYVNKKLKGKKAALILPAGSGPSDCDLTIEMFKRTFNALGIEYIDALTVEAYDIGDLTENRLVIESVAKLANKLMSN
jgi:multimeric flavodoxin WrbA